MRYVQLLALMALATLQSLAAQVEGVHMRQLWPWSTDVQVHYSLSEVTKPQDISVRFFRDGQELASPGFARSVKGDFRNLRKDGDYSFVFNPSEAFGDGLKEISGLQVEIDAVDPSVDYEEAMYKIFDLATGACTNVTRWALMCGEWGPVETDFGKIGDGFATSLSDVLIWTGVTNDIAYKTDKLVMRKVPAKDVVWTFGSGQTAGAIGDETQHQVRLSEDFYIGVFELTQAQYHKLSASPQAANSSLPDSNIRPMENCRCYDEFGVQASGNLWPGTLPGGGTELVCWPTNSYRHLAVDGCYIQFLRKKTGVPFDIPTEAQWEFACHAGTTAALNSGKALLSFYDYSANVDEVAWNSLSDYSSVGGSPMTMPVGLKKPNAFGLYDMHGNVMEFCLDSYVDDINVEHVEEPIVDPVGKLESRHDDARVKRGGYFKADNVSCRATLRNNYYSWNQRKDNIGFRLVCPASADWSK